MQHKFIKLIRSLGPIGNMRNEMYDSESKYLRIPKLLFYYKQTKNISIYDDIYNCLKSFSGNVKWTLQYPVGKKKYYIILPSIYNAEHLAEGLRPPENMNAESKVQFEEELYGSSMYYDTCNNAINDIPALYDHFVTFFRVCESDLNC